jgi:L-rhamnose mutarotase
MNVIIIKYLNDMRREAFKMYLKPGCEAEYEKRHKAIWPELKQLLKEAGVSDYTIFLDRETNVLYGCQCVAGEAGSQELGDNPIVQEWWAYMADLMDTNADYSPVSVALREVFHMD